MKIIIKCLALTLLFSCKKMEVVPEYSFVRLTQDELSSCVSGDVDCLPINEISDLQFQLITDFPSTLLSTTRNRIVAIPCDVCGELTDEEIYEYAYGKELLDVVGSSDNGGLLRLILSANFASLSVGDWVTLTNACTAGAYNYAGTYQVTQIQTMRVTVDTPFQGFIANDCDGGTDIYLTNFVNAPYLLATSSIELPDDSEFEGDNYAWNLAEPYTTTLSYNPLQCFRLCLYQVTAQINLPGELPTLISVTCLGTTNCFEKVSDLCYTTKITYGNNEDSFGFYTDGTNPFEMSVRLHLWFYAPKYPGEENGYQRSDGQFVKLSERINKTWDMETDYFPEQIHERLRIALSCDNITVTNENAQMTEVDIYRNEEYSIEWNDEVRNFPFAKGKTVVFKQLLSRSVNSNCA